MLAIVTPLALSQTHFLAQTARSIDELYSLTEVAWVICIDDVDHPQNIKQVQDVIGETHAHFCFTGQKASGPAVARKKALQYAMDLPGVVWTQFLDGDDLIIASATASVYQQALQSPLNIGWIGSSREYIGDDQERPRYVVKPENAGLYRAPNGILWENPMVFHPNNIMIKIGVLHTVAYPDDFFYNEDALFFFMLTTKFDGLVVVPATVQYRLSPQQLTVSPDYLQDKMQRFQEISRTINAYRARSGYGPLHHPFDFEQGLI